MRKRCGRGMLEGVQQRIGAHEAQIDAQQREEICVHDVREGVQAAGPLDINSKDQYYAAPEKKNLKDATRGTRD
ncbi:hypothetical protein V1477_002588 [Vespula maculifrons]|uniref:Uncharacterized protein n=1 Tax=Vespula maculifrons TaxID=7453 RepID=A0ABD2CV06_VESMC